MNLEYENYRITTDPYNYIILLEYSGIHLVTKVKSFHILIP